MDVHTLKGFISVADRLVIRSPNLPILGHICIENGTMRVTDLEHTLVMPVDDRRSYTLPFQIVKTLLKQKPEDLRIELSKDNKVLVRYGGHRLVVTSMNFDDFPAVPAFKFKRVDEWDSELILRLVSQLPFISKDQLRLALTGILLDYNQAFKSVATDGHVMRVVHHGKSNAKKLQKILPEKALRILSVPPVKPVVFSSSDKWCRFQWKDGLTLYSKWIDEKYPDYQDFADNWKLNGTALLNVEGVRGAIQSAKSFVNKVTQTLALELKNGTLGLSAEDRENETSFSTSIPTASKHNGHEIRVGFNASFLEKVLKSIKTDNVIWRYSKPFDRTYWLEDDKSPDAINLLMPIKLEG